MKISITWFREQDQEYDALILIDVLRFSTLVVTALNLGFKYVYAFEDFNEALNFSRNNGIPLFAKVGYSKPKEADFNNSPNEIIKHYRSFLEKGIDSIAIRSNAGSIIVKRFSQKKFKNIIIASTLNAKSIVNFLFINNFKKINMVCAGYKLEKLALEDYFCAGLIIHELIQHGSELQLEDEELIALHLYNSVKIDVVSAFSKSRTGKEVINSGHFDDVILASKINSVEIVPVVIGVLNNKAGIISKV
jgi:2-phosphosulfolactate phosphatase